MILEQVCVGRLHLPAELLQPHCKGNPESIHTCRCALRGNNEIFKGSEEKQLFVGGGISGIEATKILKANGKAPVIVEQYPFLGGIWSVAANDESRIQADPISFRPIEDDSPVITPNDNDPFDTIYPNRKQILERMAVDVKTFGVRDYSVFNTKVTRFHALDNDLVRVYMTQTWSSEGKQCPCCVAQFGGKEDTEEFFLDFKEIHIRTGTHSHHNAQLKYPGEDNFEGTIVAGIGNDISLSELTDQNVVIVGLGAFAVENVRRALQANAKSITVLSRQYNKLLFPECAGYLLRYNLQHEDAFELERLRVTWDTAHELLETVAKVTGMEDIVLNENCVRMVNGRKHFVFTNGFPSMASNTLYLGYHYGLVSIFEDEISRFNERKLIVTKKGKELAADVVIKSMGFGTDEALLKEHTMRDSYFVSGKASMTHNVRGDRINGQKLIGSDVSIYNFLISYYEDPQEFDRCNIILNEYPEAFNELLEQIPPTKNFCLIKHVDYFTLLELSAKLSKCKHSQIQQVLKFNRKTRKEMYMKLLPPTKFFSLDKANWDKLSAHFASITGQPILQYPFSSSYFKD